MNRPALSWPLTLLALVGCADDDTAEPRPPGVWFVSIDTLRWDAIGSLDDDGSPDTPGLDLLFEQGWSTTRAQSHAPLTLPSHGTMMTGLLPPRLGVHDNAPFRIADEVPTLAERLGTSGWRCAAIIGGRPLAAGCGLERGFDDYLDPPPTRFGAARFGESRADEVADRTIEQLEAARDEPLFLWSHFFDPHAPYTPPPRLSRGPSPRERYRGEVRFVDQQIARVVERLRASGRRWWIVITSDHGEGLGERGERTHGYQVFDSTLRVPLAIVELEGERTAVPEALMEVPRGRSAELVDLAPTLLALCGAAPFPGVDGRDLSTDPPRRPAYVESLAAALQFGWAQTTGVRDEAGWLLWTGSLSTDAARRLSASPTGRAGEYRLSTSGGAASDVDEVRRELERYRSREGKPGGSLLAALTALGYLQSTEDATSHQLADRDVNASRPSAVSRVDEIERILAAIDLVHQGKLDPSKAEAGLREIQLLTRDDPENPTLAFYEGRAQLALHEAGHGARALAASACFKRTRDLDPAFPGTRELEAQALGLAGEYDAALRIARDLHEGDPGDASSHRLLGSLLLERGTPDRPNRHRDERNGFEHLVRSVELRPDAALAQSLLHALSGTEAGASGWRDDLLRRIRSLGARH